MKNYFPLYIIIAVFAFVVLYGNKEMSDFEREVLKPASVMCEKISRGESAEDYYEKIVHSLDEHDVVLNMYINHSAYNSIMICLTEIGNDIEHDRRDELEADAKRLVYYLQDIADGEKIKINNIF